DIGGFLGIGARTVALDMDEVHFLADDAGSHFVAVNSSREQLENAPEYQRADMMTGMTGAAGDPAATAPGTMAQQPGVAGDPAATTPGMAQQPVAPGDPGTAMTGPAAGPMGMTRPNFAREGYADVDYSQLTAEDLQGATVYDGNDESIGSVGELLLDANGAIEAAVVDIGGFLCIATHSVALDFDELQIMRAADGTDVRVYIDEPRETLEQRPAHDG